MAHDHGARSELRKAFGVTAQAVPYLPPERVPTHLPLPARPAAKIQLTFYLPCSAEADASPSHGS